METDGVHEPRDALIGQNVYDLCGGGSVAVVMVPAPLHDVQVQSGTAELLGRGEREENEEEEEEENEEEEEEENEEEEEEENEEEN